MIAELLQKIYAKARDFQTVAGTSIFPIRMQRIRDAKSSCDIQVM
jgi:hypothetical protein